MPISRKRKKTDASAAVATTTPKPVILDNPSWLVPTMVGFFLVGLAWMVMFYLGGSIEPFRTLGNLWSVIVGFGFLGVGFSLATRWR